MCALHGWIRATGRCRISSVECFQRSSSNGGATWSAESQLSGPVRGYDYILPEGFRFPFGDYFSIVIDNLEPRTWCGAKGGILSLRIDLVCEGTVTVLLSFLAPPKAGEEPAVASDLRAPGCEFPAVINLSAIWRGAWVGSSSSVYLGYTPPPCFSESTAGRGVWKKLPVKYVV